MRRISSQGRGGEIRSRKNENTAYPLHAPKLSPQALKDTHSNLFLKGRFDGGLEGGFDISLLQVGQLAENHCTSVI
jgi:hypothetical protein